MKKIVALPLITFILCSCKIYTPASSSSISSEEAISSSSIEESLTSEELSTSRVVDNKYKKVSSSIVHHDLVERTSFSVFNSLNRANILCIPVVVSDYVENVNDDALTNIQNALFGEKDSTGWESLSSYYKTSSYGKFLFTGVVSSWWDCGYSSQDINSFSTKDFANLVEEATAWYKQTYDSNCSEFDLDNDGLIDGIYLIYSAPTYTSDESLSTNFWAYTSWARIEKEAIGAVGSAYTWLSYEMLFGGYGKRIDTHTLVHETGHLFGLEDYYSYTYNKDGELYTPFGGIGMMDLNVGDQDAYSKFSLGWVNPYLIDGEGEIELHSFADTGDCLIIPTSKGWNSTAFDEYLMVEFYTPTNLNKKDLVDGYRPRDTFTKDIKGAANYGIRVFHVDARLCSYSYGLTGGVVNVEYEENIPSSTQNKFVYFAHSNSPAGYDIMGNECKSLNYKSDSYRLISLISNEGRNFGKGTFYMSSSDLFKEGSGIKSYTDLKFSRQFPQGGESNNNSKFAYTFEVEECNEDRAILSFRKS